LNELLFPFMPFLADADPSQWKPEDFETSGADPDALKRELFERVAYSGRFRKKMDDAREFSKKYRETLDQETSQKLDELGVDRELPRKVYLSYLAFLKSQDIRQDTPLTPLEIRVRAWEDTERKFPLRELDWSDTEVRRFFQKRENKYEQEEHPKRNREEERAAFEAWKARELERIETAYVENYKTSLKKILEENHSPIFFKTEKKSRRVSIKDVDHLSVELDSSRQSPLVLKFDGIPVQWVVPRSPHLQAVLNAEDDPSDPWIGKKEITNVNELSAVKRIQLLNRTLTGQAKDIQGTSFEHNPQRLRSLLHKEVELQKTKRNSSRSLFVSDTQMDRFGPHFEDLVWSGRKKGKNYWRNRTKRARKRNPFAKKLIHSLETKDQSKPWFKRQIRPGFFKVMVPFIAAASIVFHGAKLAYDEGYLDEAIQKTQEVATETAVRTIDEVDYRTVDIREWLKKGIAMLPEFMRGDGGEEIAWPPSEDSRPAIGQDKIRNFYEIRRMDEKIPEDKIPPALIATIEDLEDLTEMKGFSQKGKGEIQITNESLFAHPSDNGLVGLPKPIGAEFTYLDVSTANNTYLHYGDDYTLYETKSGIPVIKLKPKHWGKEIYFRVKYNLGDVPEDTLLVPPGKVKWAAYLMKKAGLRTTADSLDKLVKNYRMHSDAAQLPGYLTPQAIANAIKSASLYSYFPKGQIDKSVPDNNPYKPLTAFLDENGKPCIQCTGADGKDGLLTETFKIALGDRDIRVNPSQVAMKKGDYYLYPFHVQTGIQRGGEDTISRYDATPTDLDPRAPEPLSDSEATKLSYASKYKRDKKGSLKSSSPFMKKVREKMSGVKTELDEARDRIEQRELETEREFTRNEDLEKVIERLGEKLEAHSRGEEGVKIESTEQMMKDLEERLEAPSEKDLDVDSEALKNLKKNLGEAIGGESVEELDKDVMESLKEQVETTLEKMDPKYLENLTKRLGEKLETFKKGEKLGEHESVEKMMKDLKEGLKSPSVKDQPVDSKTLEDLKGQLEEALESKPKEEETEKLDEKLMEDLKNQVEETLKEQEKKESNKAEEKTKESTKEKTANSEKSNTSKVSRHSTRAEWNAWNGYSRNERPSQMPADHQYRHPGEPGIVGDPKFKKIRISPKKRKKSKVKVRHKSISEKKTTPLASNQAALDALQLRLDKLINFPYSPSPNHRRPKNKVPYIEKVLKSIRGRGLPPVNAMSLAKTLIKYAKTGTGLDELRSKIKRFGFNGQLPELKSEDDLKPVFEALATNVQKQLERFQIQFLNGKTHALPEMGNPGFSYVAMDLLKEMGKHDFRQKKEKRPAGMQEQDATCEKSLGRLN